MNLGSSRSRSCRISRAGIDRRDVRNGFVSLAATPVAADRSMPAFSVIMTEAETIGLRPAGSNPCRGVRRYRRNGRQRLLSDGEIRRLFVVLLAHADECPGQVAVIRLLLVTGCREREILTLQRSDQRERHPFLPNSKTGPRRGPLGTQTTGGTIEPSGGAIHTRAGDGRIALPLTARRGAVRPGFRRPTMSTRRPIPVPAPSRTR